MPQRALGVAGDPVRLKPTDVAQLPERRIEDEVAWHFGAIELAHARGEGGEGVGAAGDERARECCGIGMSNGFGFE